VSGFAAEARPREAQAVTKAVARLGGLHPGGSETVDAECVNAWEKIAQWRSTPGVCRKNWLAHRKAPSSGREKIVSTPVGGPPIGDQSALNGDKAQAAPEIGKLPGPLLFPKGG